MKRWFATALLAPVLLAAGAAHAGPKKPVQVAIVSTPAGALSVDALGEPIAGIVDLAPQLPPGVTDSVSFEIPAGRHLILDQVGAFANFDAPLPAGQRFSLFLDGQGVQMPIGFGEVVDGNQIHVVLPTAIVLSGSFRFAILGGFGGAEVTFARYSFTGRLVPAQ